MVAAMPSYPYITEMIPAGFATDGNMTFRMTGFFAEVFDNLQVRKASLTEFIFNMNNDSLFFYCRI